MTKEEREVMREAMQEFRAQQRAERDAQKAAKALERARQKAERDAECLERSVAFIRRRIERDWHLWKPPGLPAGLLPTDRALAQLAERQAAHEAMLVAWSRTLNSQLKMEPPEALDVLRQIVAEVAAEASARSNLCYSLEVV
jgi:hypothetical protein